jgi:hypothetical protein
MEDIQPINEREYLIQYAKLSPEQADLVLGWVNAERGSLMDEIRQLKSELANAGKIRN